MSTAMWHTPLHQVTCRPPVAMGAFGAHVIQWRSHTIRCTAVAGDRNSDGSNLGVSIKHTIQQQQSKNPWYIGFQTNERTLQWEESAQVQMTKLYISQKSGKDMAWVDDRLGELVVLLPDIVAKLGRVKADLVLALASDTQGIAQRMVELEAVLPGVDLSRLTARYPALLLEHTAADVRAKLAALREALPAGVSVERLVEVEPVLLDVDIAAVLADIRRLLPGQDAARMLLGNPGIVLDMTAFKMGSSLQDTQ